MTDQQLLFNRFIQDKKDLEARLPVGTRFNFKGSEQRYEIKLYSGKNVFFVKVLKSGKLSKAADAEKYREFYDFRKLLYRGALRNIEF